MSDKHCQSAIMSGFLISLVDYQIAKLVMVFFSGEVTEVWCTMCQLLVSVFLDLLFICLIPASQIAYQLPPPNFTNSETV
jgi:hypothetical protein